MQQLKEIRRKKRGNEMGADLELVEDDVLVIEVTDYKTNKVLIRASVNVKKGKKLILTSFANEKVLIKKEKVSGIIGNSEAGGGKWLAT